MATTPIRRTYLYTIEQMRGLEALADAAGHSYDAMMELAGKAIADEVQHQLRTEQTEPSGKVLVIAGPGNNGGDGLVTARYLAERGYKVAAFVWRRPTPDPQGMAARQAGVAVLRDLVKLPKILSQVGVVVDALFGIGLSRPIEGEPAAILEAVETERQQRIRHHNNSLRIIGVDGPSGLNGDTGNIDPKTLPATTTISCGGVKVGMLSPNALEITGLVQVADLEIPDVVLASAPHSGQWMDMRPPSLPKRSRGGHKGTFGTVMVVGGSINYVGAPALSALAAGRSGVGLVTLAVPMAIQPMLAARPDLTTATWLPLAHEFGAIRKEAAETVQKALEKVNALVLGPGLGSEETTKEFVHTLLGIITSAPPKGAMGFVGWRDATPPPTVTLPPVVVDADALNALAAYGGEWWRNLNHQLVLTPHPAELGRLLQRDTSDIQSNRLASAREAAERFGQVVVLKGAYTIVTTPQGEVSVSAIATSALAKAGSGDVLAGIIGALLAQGLSPYEAAVAGVGAHGLAVIERHSPKTAYWETDARWFSAIDLIQGLRGVWEISE